MLSKEIIELERALDSAGKDDQANVKEQQQQQQPSSLDRTASSNKASGEQQSPPANSTSCLPASAARGTVRLERTNLRLPVIDALCLSLIVLITIVDPRPSIFLLGIDTGCRRRRLLLLLCNSSRSRSL